MAGYCSAPNSAQRSVQPQPQITEFSIRLAKTCKKRHSLMRFNKEMKVDFSTWKNAKLERENNFKSMSMEEEEMPKFGAGSEYGRDAREEARRRKFCSKPKKYESSNQPWILKPNGESGKKFKGIREGGVGANSSYYVFKQGENGLIEAYPLHEWYKFQSIQRYKTLNAEEAEEEFLRRDKTLNYFNVMLKKKLRNEEDDSCDAEMMDDMKKMKIKGKQDLKISEMDEWIDSDEEDSDKDDDCKGKSDDEDYRKKKKADLKKKKNKKKKVAKDEAFEESDDGDEEGRECEYISDSSASEDELELQKEIKSVDQESALKKLLVSDDEDEDEDDDEDKDKEDNQESDDEDKKEAEEDAKKNKGGKSNTKTEGPKALSDAKAVSKKKEVKKPNLQPSTSTSKRNADSSLDAPKAKKVKLSKDEKPPVHHYAVIPGSVEFGITEEAVRRYLLRKPMTVTDLLLKFKSKKMGIKSEDIAAILTNVLLKLNPSSQVRNGKMYYHINA